MSAGFDLALRGASGVLELARGDRIPLSPAQWHARPDAADELLLDRCTGVTLDVGCGPGRLTEALGSRGVPALGIDISPVAVALTRARGALALHRDVFSRLPAEGRWRHVLVIDGNVGIGGDPTALLCRVAALLAPGGTALVELEPPGVGCVRTAARLVTADGRSEWFPWARLGMDAVAAAAAAACLRVRWRARHHQRCFVELASA